MDKILVCLAIFTAKSVSYSIRLFGLGMGSSLPGKIASFIYPDILPYLARQLSRGCLAVTGTNGKSTTSGLLASILAQAKYHVIHNRQGANLIGGISSAFVQAAKLNGSLEDNFALLEVDEAALPILAKQVKCQNIVVTNLFRDQLDRFGELDTTAKLIAKGIAENNSIAILNADDPNVCNLPCTANKVFYGLNDGKKVDNVNVDTINSEISYCPKCGFEIDYEYKEGLGNVWICPNCNNSRPAVDFFANSIELMPDFSFFTINDNKNQLSVKLQLPGIFNVYNATAAGAAAFSLGISLQTIKEGLENYQTLFGRSEKLRINDRNVVIQLIKNPAGASKSLASLTNSKCAKALIAINDNYADGRDVSWLWDANFEILANTNISFIVSGQRAQDMSVRLKYAGINENSISCIPSLSLAFNEALKQVPSGETVWILPTYTALLEMQNIIKEYKYASL